MYGPTVSVQASRALSYLDHPSTFRVGQDCRIQGPGKGLYDSMCSVQASRALSLLDHFSSLTV